MDCRFLRRFLTVYDKEGPRVGFAVAPQSEKFFGHRRFGSRCVAAESAEAAAVCCCDKA